MIIIITTITSSRSSSSSRSYLKPYSCEPIVCFR